MSARITRLESTLREVQRIAIRAQIERLVLLDELLHHPHVETHVKDLVALDQITKLCDHALNKNVEA